MMIISHGAAAALIKAAHIKISRQKDPLTLRILGRMFFFGILPDLPLTLLVISGKFDPSIHYHHKWITHTPVFWLIISFAVTKLFSRQAGSELLAATWLHLGMDWYGGADGIPFLYPLTNRQFGLGLSGINGPEGFKVYFSNPLFLFFELFVQVTFFLVLIFQLRKRFFQSSN